MPILQTGSLSQTVSIRKHKHKLKFEQICKHWSKLLKEQPGVVEILTLDGDFPHYLGLRSTMYCIVGEAHGFSSKYFDHERPEYCKTCREFANDFDILGTQDSRVNSFVDHFNEAHVKP